MPRPHVRRRLLLLVVATLLAACGRDRADLIDRETFVAVYVDLRVAGLRAPDGMLPDTTRARILEAHGVDEQDLRAFADAHGANLTYVRDLWNEIEAKLDSVPVSLDAPR